MEIECPSCEKSITVLEQHYNQQVYCPYCSQSLFLEEQSIIPNEDPKFKDAANEIFRSSNFDAFIAQQSEENPNYFVQLEQINELEQAKLQIQKLVERFKALLKEQLIQDIDNSNLSDSEADKKKRTWDILFNIPSFDELIVEQLKKTHPKLFKKLEQKKPQKKWIEWLKVLLEKKPQKKWIECVKVLLVVLAIGGFIWAVIYLKLW